MISFLSFFFTDPNLFKLICGSDMDMILNLFFVFWEPNTSNFIRHMFLYLFFYLFFNDNEINVNILNFCPPVYIATEDLYLMYILRTGYDKSMVSISFKSSVLHTVYNNPILSIDTTVSDFWQTTSCWQEHVVKTMLFVEAISYRILLPFHINALCLIKWILYTCICRNRV